MDNDYLHRQLIKLGDMMGDGLHLEPGGAWINREYRKTLKALHPEMFPKKDFSHRDKSVAIWCAGHLCSRCGGQLRQTRSGALRVICKSCNKLNSFTSMTSSTSMYYMMTKAKH